MTNANANTITLSYSNAAHDIVTTDCTLRENCITAALNTLVYRIQCETVSLSEFGSKIKGVTKTDARRSAERQLAKCAAIDCLTNYSATPLVRQLHEDITAALCKANAALTKPSKPQGGFGPVIHMVK